jgi:hypothetical protein
VTPDGAVIDRPALALAPGPPHKGLLAIGAGDGQVLVAWSQQPVPDPLTLDYDLYGLPLSTAGERLTPEPVPLVTAPDSQVPEAISWNGASYLLAYSEASVVTGALRGVRMDAGGAVLTPGGFALFAPDARDSKPMALAWTGQEHLLVWTRPTATGAGLWTARLGTSGTESATGLTSLAEIASGRSITGPRISLGGPQPLVVWEEGLAAGPYRDIVGIRMAAAGTPVEAKPFPVSSGGNAQSQVALASNGRQLFAVWVDGRTPGAFECWGTRLSTRGEVLDATGIFLSTTDAFCARPAVTWNGSSWTVAWQQDQDANRNDARIRVRQVGEDGTPAASIVALTDFGFEAGPAVASDGQQVIVVWEHLASEGTGWDLRAQRIDGSGARVDAQPFVLSSAPLNQRDPDVVWNGEGYLAAWSDDRFGNTNVYASRITPQGLVSAPMGPLSPAPIASNPRIAWNGEHHLIAWVESGETSPTVRAARVSRDGQLVDSRTFESARGASGRPAATAIGATFAVAWHEDGFPDHNILIRRLSATLEPLGPARLEVLPPSPGAERPVLASAGSGAVIAYQVYDPSFLASRVRRRTFGEDSLPDAGSEPDAGSPSVGAVDAPPDTRSPDGGVDTPAATGPDASTDGGRADAAGCQCTVARRSPPVGPTLLLAAAWALRFRSRCRRRARVGAPHRPAR